MAVIIVLLIVVFIVLYSMGIFAKVEVEERVMDQMVLVYEDYLGPYKNTKKIQDKVYYGLLNDLNIETYKGFGIYYDNPKKVEASKCRSKSGCILEKTDYDKYPIIEERYKVMEWKEGRYIYTEFPFSSSLSIFGSLLKVYPKLNQYLVNNNYEDGEVMEIYDVPNKKILFLMEIKK